MNSRKIFSAALIILGMAYLYIRCRRELRDININLSLDEEFQ